MATTAETIILGAGQTGLTLGVRVLDQDRVLVTAHTTTNVAETAVLGTYYAKADVGAELRGWIVWAIDAGADVGEAPFDVSAAAATDPLLNDVPGVYDEGTAGYALGAVGTAGVVITASGSIPDNGADWNIRRGDTVPVTVTTTTAPSATRTQLWVTAKRRLSDPDSAALFQIAEVGGLVVLNGEALPDGIASTDGAITSVDVPTKAVVFTLTKAAAALLDPRSDIHWDVQHLVAGDPITIETGTGGAVLGDVTRATA